MAWVGVSIGRLAIARTYAEGGVMCAKTYFEGVGGGGK